MKPFTLIAGPCVVESEEITMQVAHELKVLCNCYNIPFIFKSSYRKANRTHLLSFSGMGTLEALEILHKIKQALNISITTDIHSVEEAELAAHFIDILQIPAFLSRQTDILIAAGNTGKMVNIKKGQFMTVADLCEAVFKVASTTQQNIIVTERGSCFGYNDLVVDMRNILLMKRMGYPVSVFVDITHSNMGHPEMSETLGKCAIAAGADGIFLETHPDPSRALSDGKSMLPLYQIKPLLEKLLKIREAL